MNKLTLKRRILRVKNKVKSVNRDRYRLSIYRSSKNIFAQIIDDSKSRTIVSASSVEKSFPKTNKGKSNISTMVGENLAKRAIEKKIRKIYLDRSKYKYHGRIKILTEVLRKKGLEL